MNIVKSSALSPPTSQTHHWINGHGCAATKKICELATDSDRLTLLVSKDSENTIRLVNEIAFFNPNLPLLVFPDHETLPYDTFSAPVELIAERLSTLYKLPEHQSGVVVLSIRTLMERLSPVNYVHSHSLICSLDEDFELSDRRDMLTKAGYRHVGTVYEPGEYAIRGSIFDVFAIGSTQPLRIELFDDKIESLRFFDPETQLSSEKVETVRLLPAKEFPLHVSGIERFRNAWHARFDVDVRYCSDYQDISNGVAPDGIECFLPLFFSETSCFLDHLKNDPLVILDENLEESANDFWDEIGERYENLRHDPRRPLLAPEELYLTLDQLRFRWRDYPKIQLDTYARSTKHQIDLGGWQLPNLEASRHAQVPADSLRELVQDHSRKTLIVAETQGRREYLLDFLARSDLYPYPFECLLDFELGQQKLGITVAPLDRGCAIDDICIVSEMQLFGGHSASVQTRERRRVVNPELILRNLAEIELDSPVVHIDYGVGRYRGLEVVSVGNYPMEFMTLEYARGDKVYVPVTSLHLISRYVGADGESVPLHQLGTQHWKNARKKAAEKIHDVAAELLNVYARREISEGFKYPPKDTDYEAFCTECEFELTDDQADSVNAILTDLCDLKSMDRLVCGDVGFGKTEVAMRAAFHVVQAAKQVAVLVPTTLLAQQHYDTFVDRFANWPHQIELLSRMRTGGENASIKQAIREGGIDILIGTHALLSNSINFKELGLLIVDEEHRFGVRQKERIRKLKAEVDLLTLTATPIPRTLNLALEGVRDLSIIATPPARRLSIKTFVTEVGDSLIRDAITRELDRGGQVYSLHNRVRTIADRAEYLQKLVPQARIGIAHGEMPKHQLESVMADFYHRRCNLLVCTTIIESGLDVPNANTIIMERADRFGLAQLHQLRGRVGRSHRQAYAYLLTPPETVLTADAQKRLEAIESADELGAGFTLAMNDLEIRGAGEILGREQSGQIATIGFSLYMKMLEETIEAMRSNRVIDLDAPFEIAHEVEFHIPVLIPADYLPDVKARLILYRRLANADTNLALDKLQVEVIDRFGQLPIEVKNLFRTTRVKLAAKRVGIKSINMATETVKIEFADHTKFNTERLIDRMQHHPDQYKLLNENKLNIVHGQETDLDRLRFMDEFLEFIALDSKYQEKAA